MLRATPVLELGEGGSIDVGGMFFGRKNRLGKFVRFIKRRQDISSNSRVLIAHAECPEEAKELETLLREALPGIQDIQTTQLGTAIGVHGGAGTLVVAIQKGYELPEKTSS